jgi:repressor LexA
MPTRRQPRTPIKLPLARKQDPLHASGDRPTLTRRQADVVRFIASYRLKHGLSPTLAEIGDGLGVSRVTVFEHVRALEEKGWLEGDPGRSRSLRVCETDTAQAAAPATHPLRKLHPDAAHRDLPFVGRIAAGQPIEAVEERASFDVNGFFRAERGNFMLEVRGDSMIEDQIRDGDFVLVEPRQRAHPGETVVALLRGEEATLKRYYPEANGTRVRLEPRNASLRPMHFDARDVIIQGVVIGVVRRY